MAESESNELESVEQQAENAAGVKILLKCNKSGKELHVIMKQNVKIRTVLRGFCQTASLDYRSTRFVLNQREFAHAKTAKQLGLHDGDQIDALTDTNGA